jgi:hypothetical protein
MSDTVSATQFWSLGDVRMNFLAPTGAPSSQPETGNRHISGGVHSTYASPSLIVEFATASPDFQAPGPGPTPEPVPPTVSAYAFQAADDLRPVVIIGAQHT